MLRSCFFFFLSQAWFFYASCQLEMKFTYHLVLLASRVHQSIISSSATHHYPLTKPIWFLIVHKATFYLETNPSLATTARPLQKCISHEICTWTLSHVLFHFGYINNSGVDVIFFLIISAYGMDFPISFRVASLALEQTYECPSASEVTLNDMGEIDCYQTTLKHEKPTLCTQSL